MPLRNLTCNDRLNCYDESLHFPMNILLDARDLIELAERARPATVAEVGAFLETHGYEFVFSFTNIRELASTLAVNHDFLRVRPWLQALEKVPHRYIREAVGPYEEIQGAVNEFNGGARCQPALFVRRWDGTLVPLPGEGISELERLVNVRLDDIVYWLYIARPAVFAPPAQYLRPLQIHFDEDRRALRAKEAPAEEHSLRVVKKHSVSFGIQLPTGREDDFARWLYESPDRCPGLRFGHEVY
jgi:hypothetical protein